MPDLRCPLCSEPLECYYQKRQKVFAVVHGRGNGLSFSPVPCLGRFKEFGRGETEELAWATAERNIHAYLIAISEQPQLKETNG